MTDIIQYIATPQFAVVAVCVAVVLIYVINKGYNLTLGKIQMAKVQKEHRMRLNLTQVVDITWELRGLKEKITDELKLSAKDATESTIHRYENLFMAIYKDELGGPTNMDKNEYTITMLLFGRFKNKMYDIFMRMYEQNTFTNSSQEQLDEKAREKYILIRGEFKKVVEDNWIFGNCDKINAVADRISDQIKEFTRELIGEYQRILRQRFAALQKVTEMRDAYSVFIGSVENLNLPVTDFDSFWDLSTGFNFSAGDDFIKQLKKRECEEDKK